MRRTGLAHGELVRRLICNLNFSLRLADWHSRPWANRDFIAKTS